jgi:multidrug efflux pump subunit AcrB
MSEKKDNKTMNGLKAVWKWVYRLRSVILAIPVAAGAVILAIHNQANLPDEVGINIQASGEYAEMVGKSVAVLGPLAVTAVCLLMVFCSRKVLYPWLISLFSLALPILIYITNIFPG